MNKVCVVVADGGRARFFDLEAVDTPRAQWRLAERAELVHPDVRTLGASVTGRPRTETNSNRGAGPVHPIGAQRERHRLELDRRFAQEIAQAAADAVRGWKEGTVVLIADPRLLGLMRGMVRDVLAPAIGLKELAKDYVKLTPQELHEQLAGNGLIPPQRPGNG